MLPKIQEVTQYIYDQIYNFQIQALHEFLEIPIAKISCLKMFYKWLIIIQMNTEYSLAS